jgi:transaldolase
VDAQQVLDDLAKVGVDYDDVVRVLEDEAIEKFETSWIELIESIQGELDKLGAEVASGSTSAGSKK